MMMHDEWWIQDKILPEYFLIKKLFLDKFG